MLPQQHVNNRIKPTDACLTKFAVSLASRSIPANGCKMNVNHGSIFRRRNLGRLNPIQTSFSACSQSFGSPTVMQRGTV